MTEHIGKNIQYYRKQKGLTQEQLAELVGFSLSSLKSIECGNNLATLENFMYICDALDIPADFILADSGKRFRVAAVAQMMEWLMNLEDAHFEQLSNTIELIYYFKSHMKDPPFIFQKKADTPTTKSEESLLVK